MYGIHITAEAEDDIKNAFNWYEGQLSGLGERFLNALEERYHDLRKHPEHYSFINENPHMLYRDVMLRRFPFRVVFRIQGQLVAVIAVYHASLDPQKLKYRITGGN